MTYPWRLTSVFLLGFFLDCINIFMSAIALPAIADAFSVSQAWIGWVSTSYILGLTLAMPLSLYFAQRLGARKLLAASMLLFACTATLTAVSPNFVVLLTWRFVQGIAGGLLIPIGQALVFAQFTGERRNQVSVVMMAVALIAPAFSPLLGGYLVDYFSWSLIFLSSAPIALLTALLAWRWVADNDMPVALSLDKTGLALISLFLLCLLLLLSLYVEHGVNWISLLLLGLTLGFALSYWHYQKHHSALVDLALLRNLNLRVCLVLYHAVPGVFTAINLLAIFYLQKQLSFTAQKTGSFMLFYAAGALFFMLKSNRWLLHIGAKQLLIIGLLTHIAGALCLAVTPVLNNAFSWLLLCYLLLGAGGGLIAALSQSLALADFTDESLAKASVLWNINRQLCFSLGVALSALLLNLLEFWATAEMIYNLSFLGAALISSLALLILIKLPSLSNKKP